MHRDASSLLRQGRSSSMGVVSRACPTCQTSYGDEAAFCGTCGTVTLQERPAGDADPRIGTQLGGYIVVAMVADGAMGRVYEGRHPETKARVAIKVLHPDVARDDVAVERFRREYDAAKELEHPHIVRVLDFGETSDGSRFMTMEFLTGEELGDLLARQGAQPPERIVRIVCQVALALEDAHSFGFIHRDLKPDNIFLRRGEGGDDVRILDFGSVKLQMETGRKLTALGTTLGSPYYMSPEQAAGKHDVDGRTDVFALSAILYEMLTGNVAFEAPNVAGILMKIMNETPRPPSSLATGMPASVDDVVEKGLRKDKARRYASATALAEALLNAYGLRGSVETWANEPQEDIARALAEATPAPPRPFGDSMPPQQTTASSPAVARPRTSARSGSFQPVAGTSSNRGLWVAGILLGAAVLAGGVMALLLR